MELEVIDELESDHRAVLKLRGSIDLATRGMLTEKATTAVADGAVRALVLDLAGVTFFDSSGLGALVQVAGDAADAGKQFSLRNPSDRVMRVLSIAGLTDAWTVENSAG